MEPPPRKCAGVCDFPFVRRHGERAYTQALTDAVRAGVGYTGDLDALNDPEQICALLEKYLK